MKLIVTIFSAFALAGTLSFAEDGPPKRPGAPRGDQRHERPSPEEIFKKLDANHDGMLSLDEFKAHRPHRGPGAPGVERRGPRAEGKGPGDRPKGPIGERKRPGGGPAAGGAAPVSPAE